MTSRAFRIRVALVEKLKDTSSKSMTGTPESVQHWFYSCIEWRTFMYPGCHANSVKWSTKWLPEHVVYLFEILVSEDYLYEKNVRKRCHSVWCIQIAI